MDTTTILTSAPRTIFYRVFPLCSISQVNFKCVFLALQHFAKIQAHIQPKLSPLSRRIIAGLNNDDLGSTIKT